MQLIWPWQDRQRKFSWLKASGFALALFPGLRFVYQFAVGDYGFLPIALGGLVYWSGVWATVVLLMALAVTPVMTVLRWPALVDVRRIIGVTALVYTLVHVIFYFMLRSWNWPVILPELVARTSMVVGVISTIGLIVLGATSLDAVIRAMGTKGWQRLHNTNYVISALAVLHVVLSRGNYPEQYLLGGLFVWLMAWRVLARYGRGADPVALAILTVACSLFTALLEAGMMWGRRGYDVVSTLRLNFNPDLFDINIPPTWQVLVYGLLFAIAAAVGRQAFRVRTARLAAARVEARQSA